MFSFFKRKWIFMKLLILSEQYIFTYACIKHYWFQSHKCCSKIFFNQDYDHADPCVLMSLKKTPPSHFSQTFLLLKVWVNQGYIKIELDSY